MLLRLFRRIARWHHEITVRDIDWQIRVHQAHHAALPAEITRLEQIRRFHVGRAVTLVEPSCRVNWRLGRVGTRAR